MDAADIKAMWAYGQKLKAEHPEGGEGAVAVGASVWKQILAPGVDTVAVGYRFGMLGLLEMMLRGGLDPGENQPKMLSRSPPRWI